MVRRKQIEKAPREWFPVGIAVLFCFTAPTRLCGLPTMRGSWGLSIAGLTSRKYYGYYLWCAGHQRQLSHWEGKCHPFYFRHGNRHWYVCRRNRSWLEKKLSWHYTGTQLWTTKYPFCFIFFGVKCWDFLQSFSRLHIMFAFFIVLGIDYIQTKLNKCIIRIIKLGWINN